jgi:hypothetical protein
MRNRQLRSLTMADVLAEAGYGGPDRGRAAHHGATPKPPKTSG